MIYELCELSGAQVRTTDNDAKQNKGERSEAAVVFGIHKQRRGRL